MQNLLEEIYMPEEILRLLLGGVGWGFGLMFAGQGDNAKSDYSCDFSPE